MPTGPFYFQVQTQVVSTKQMYSKKLLSESCDGLGLDPWIALDGLVNSFSSSSSKESEECFWSIS